MKSILVPTDFSEGSFTALKIAIKLADKLGYNVHVFHAYSMPPTGDAVMVNITEILEKNAIEELGILKKRARTLEYGKSVNVSYKAHHGQVVDVINRLGTVDHNHMAIMSTRGANDFSKKILGTNASDATKNVKIPLLIIPPNASIPDTPKFLFAVDLKVLDNNNSHKFFSEFANDLNSEILFVNIKNDNRKVDESQKEKYLTQLDRDFGKERAKLIYFSNTDIEEGITEAITKMRPDILVLVRHNFTFLESIFHSSISLKLVKTAPIPIFVLQA